MEVVPLSMGRAARGWDEQHLDLAAATRQLRGVTTAGFTGPVSGVAARFTAGWERSTRALGGECEQRADGLRAAIDVYVASDAAQGMRLWQLMAVVQEAR